MSLYIDPILKIPLNLKAGKCSTQIAENDSRQIAGDYSRQTSGYYSRQEYRGTIQ